MQAARTEFEMDDEPLTLGQLLREQLLRNARYEPVEHGLDRRITWCTPWEQALAGEDSLAGVLLYARSAQVTTDQVPDLVARGAAALAVAGTLRASVHAGLPTVILPPGVTFHELSRLVAELTLARETHLLRYTQAVHRLLVQLLYRGVGLTAMCQEMARLTGCSVAVLDAHHRALAFEQGEHRPVDAAAVARALEAALAEPARGTEAAAAPAAGLVLRLDELGVTCVVHPIVLAALHQGWVLVIESADPPHPHDLDEHRVVVQQAASIVGTELLRLRSVTEAKERSLGDFAYALLHGRFATVHDIDARAAHYGFPTDADYGVIVAGGLGLDGAATPVDILVEVARDATGLVPRPGVQTLATVVGNMVAVIRQVLAPDPTPDAADRELGRYASALDEEVHRKLCCPAQVAYGRPVHGAMRILDSYRQARLALGLRERLGIDRVCGFAELRVYATLAELSGSAQAREFARDLLSPLRQGHAGTEGLEEVALAYIAAGGHVNAAARELHIHRNTMLYKLDHASRVLQLDLRQAEHQFAVCLAHKLDLLAETTAATDRSIHA